MIEDNFKVQFYVKADFVDIVKLLFGRCLRIDLNLNMALDTEEGKPFIKGVNHGVKVTTSSSTTHFVKTSKLPYGYERKE